MARYRPQHVLMLRPRKGKARALVRWSIASWSATSSGRTSSDAADNTALDVASISFVCFKAAEKAHILWPPISSN